MALQLDRIPASAQHPTYHGIGPFAEQFNFTAGPANTLRHENRIVQDSRFAATASALRRRSFANSSSQIPRPMPSDDGAGLNQAQPGFPSIPSMGEPCPQSPIHWRQPWSVGTQAQDHQLVTQSQVSQKASCGRNSARLQADGAGHSANESCGGGFRETSWKPSVFGWMRFLPTTPPAFSDHPNQVCPNRV